MAGAQQALDPVSTGIPQQQHDLVYRGQLDSATSAQEEVYLKQFSCLYFGYGSNLSPRTIKQRCPDSLFISLARVSGWRWIINETGYANIIPGDPDDEVWGTLCFLSRRDEKALDESEGVPWLYEKIKLKVRRVPQDIAGLEWKDTEGEELEATVYVDAQRTTEGRVEREYVIWLRKAIEDAKACGMPDSYVDQYIRKHVPEVNDTSLSDQDIMMARTMQFGEHDAGVVPRGFASWSRG